jgi:hypothetical protein
MTLSLGVFLRALCHHAGPDADPDETDDIISYILT